MSEHFNQLTPAELERLAILSEEMGEVQQVIGKILRHGYESQNPDSSFTDTNRNDLTRELGDVLYAIDSLIEAKDVPNNGVARAMVRKEEKVQKYLHHNPETKTQGEDQ